MARPLRYEYEGAFYHIISRGERQEDIYRSNKDREKFLQKLHETAEKHLIRIHCYILMSNHYHLILETPHMNLSKAMHDLNSSFSNWLKAKYSIVGSVFQGRYKSPLIEKESYLTVLSAYIHLNPVRAGIVDKPDKYKWSSYPIYLGKRNNPEWLCTSLILEEFRNDRQLYENFVLDWQKKKQPEYSVRHMENQTILGSEGFIKSIEMEIKKQLIAIDQREIPAVRRLVKLEGKDIIKILLRTFNVAEDECIAKKRGNVYRKMYVYGLKRYTNLQLSEIGEIMGINYTAVSELFRRFVADSAKDKKVQKKRELFECAIAKYKADCLRESTECGK